MRSFARVVDVVLTVVLSATLIQALSQCGDGKVTPSGLCACKSELRLPRCVSWSRECGVAGLQSTHPLAYCRCGTASNEIDPLTGACSESPSEQHRENSTRETAVASTNDNRNAQVLSQLLDVLTGVGLAVGSVLSLSAFVA